MNSINKILKHGLLVSVAGPDPLQVKASNHVVATKKNGRTTLSGSGIFIDFQNGLALTSGSLLFPFINRRNRTYKGSAKTTQKQKSVLLPNTKISVKIDQSNFKNNSPVYSNGEEYFHCKLLGFLQSSEIDENIRKLLSGTDGWHLGWKTTSSNVVANPYGDSSHDNEPSSTDGCMTETKTTTEELLFGSIPKHNTLSLIAIIQIQDQNYYERLQKLSNHDYRAKFCNDEDITIGTQVSFVSSPFGTISSTAFSNTLTTGIISNILLHNKQESYSSISSIVTNFQSLFRDSKQPEYNNNNNDHSIPSIIITDCRMYPGSEGGGLFTHQNGNLIGMATLPLKRNDSPVELNIVINLKTYAPQLLKIMNTPHYHQTISYRLLFSDSSVKSFSSFPYLKDLPSKIQNAYYSMVIVVIGSVWASGFIASNHGHIITNAHVIPNDFSSTFVDTYVIINSIESSQERKTLPVSILFKSSGTVDIAVLQINDWKNTQRSLSKTHRVSVLDFTNSSMLCKNVSEGEDVFVIGFPLYSPNSEIAPTITKGIISKVLKRPSDNSIAMLETTAAVHKGNSGGVVVSEQGCIGVITSHAKLRYPVLSSIKQNRRENLPMEETIVPTINFAIPINLLSVVSQYFTEYQYLDSPDNISMLKEEFGHRLTSQNDEELTSIWKLAPVPPNVAPQNDYPNNNNNNNVDNNNNDNRKMKKQQDKKRKPRGSQFMKHLQQHNINDSTQHILSSLKQHQQNDESYQNDSFNFPRSRL